MYTSYQNSFSRVAGNDAKMGYFPTDVDCVRMIKTHLNIPEGINVFDPCVGEGIALATLCKDVKDVSMLGIELSEQRGKEARTRGIETLIGGYETCTLTPGAFPLIFLNPPYGVSSINGKMREEEEFIRRATNHITRGGIIVFVVPQYILEEKLVKFLCSRYTVEAAYKFPQLKEDFKQVVLILRRNVINASLSEEEIEGFVNEFQNMPILVEGANEINVPTLEKTKLVNFHAKEWDAELGLAFTNKLCKKTTFIADELEMEDPSNLEVGQPLMDLKPDLKFLMLASGVVSGNISVGTPQEHLQRGKVQIVETKEDLDEDGEAFTVTSHASVSMTTIERDGTITHLM